RDEVADADRTIDSLAAPVELSRRGKGTRDRRPGQRKIDIVKRFGDAIGHVFVCEHAILDSYFGKRHLVVRTRLHAARGGLDERCPVALAIAETNHADMRPQHHEISDLEALQQQRQQSRSEEHTSELQSLAYLVCRLLLE